MTKTREEKIKFIYKQLQTKKTVYKKVSGFSFKVSFLNGGQEAVIFNQNLGTVTKFNFNSKPIEKFPDDDIDFLYQLLR